MPVPEWISGNLYIRPNYLDKAGDLVDGHTHNFDHTTIVWKGKVSVEATTPDGRTFSQVFEAGRHFLVKAEVKHKITALEDGTVFWCVYAHRDPQGRVTQEYNGWYEAYQ